ncbi:MAG TPA: rhodanese-like domain-containing protein [Bacilli bacterium]
MIIIIFILLLSLIFYGCTEENKKISPHEAKQLIDDNKVIIIDVRSQEEYEEERLKNAILLPLEAIESNAKNVFPDLERIYLVYCQTGKRSCEAVEIFKNLGFKEVYAIGGLDDWPYEKEKHNQENK